jgi:hypothetical protein
VISSNVISINRLILHRNIAQCTSYTVASKTRENSFCILLPTLLFTARLTAISQRYPSGHSPGVNTLLAEDSRVDTLDEAVVGRGGLLVSQRGQLMGR